MADPKDIDGILVQWGNRLFYPGNRIVTARREPRLIGNLLRDRATAIRARIEATAVRRAPQVMVKVTGGGRGMKAIAAHFRYVSKHGHLDMEDELGNVERGKEAVRDMAKDWRFGGSYIGGASDRREAFNIMLSMPSGTDPLAVLRAARDFARLELADHKYVMVLHDHQANPHVHISVRAESKHARRLNPRKADLHRWRETFAKTLRGWGIDAEATRQATRGADRNYPALWRVKAASRGALRTSSRPRKSGPATFVSRQEARASWAQILGALRESSSDSDRRLGSHVDAMLADADRGRIAVSKEAPPAQSIARGPDLGPARSR